MHKALQIMSLATLIYSPWFSKTWADNTWTLTSPDSQLSITLNAPSKGHLTYQVNYRNTPIILPSKMGLELDDTPPVGIDLLEIQAQRAQHNQTWQPPFGERKSVRDAYQALTLTGKHANSELQLVLECRAYNAGFAFRYTLPRPEHKTLTVKRELTEYRFTANHRAWPVYAAQGMYQATPLDELKKGTERPLTIEIANGPVVALGEAGLFTFARMKYAPLEGEAHTLVATLDGSAQLTLPAATPWRFVMVAANVCRLLENNDLLLNLNEPSKIADTSWIKPGKVIRETSLTTAGGKACVDFAKVMNLQYVEYDAGWYGHEYDDTSDARTVTLDPKRSKGPLDLPAVIRYAKENDIGIIVYVNRRELENRLDDLLPLYKSWGIVGMKYGFVNVGNQHWTTWLHEAIRKAGEAQMMIDIHDEYRLTGNQRTWPNVMTVEGIAGNETMPDAPHNCALPFTRYLCGPGDYTPCWYNNRVKNSRAHQLALGVVTYSPWQFLFWYDHPGMYKAEPELDFWRQMPTTWDDTRVLHGAIGEYASIARRTGNDWFVGTINAQKQREFDIPLNFLAPNRTYTAHIYSDGAPDGSAPQKVHCSTLQVTAKDTISAQLAHNGGHAIHLIARD